MLQVWIDSTSIAMTTINYSNFEQNQLIDLVFFVKYLHAIVFRVELTGISCRHCLPISSGNIFNPVNDFIHKLKVTDQWR